MLDPRPADESEEELLEQYKREAHALVKGSFDQKQVRGFTQKIIERQLDSPALASSDFSPEDCARLESMTALQVRELLFSDPQMSLEKVVRMYHWRKKEARNAGCLLTWSFFQAPLARARDLDRQVAEMGPAEARRRLPLYGFVLSVKDSVYVKDSPSTCGLFANLDRVASEDPATIQALKAAGAVVTCKGNIPQFLFSMESVNNLFGVAQNPFDAERTTGGSSGGDCGLIATGMVNAGLGSDGAGSLRIPALFCGLCSLKPTPYRLSMLAHASYLSRAYGSEALPQRFSTSGDKQYVALPTIGPLAKSAKDLAAMLQVLYADQAFDNSIVPMPWNPRVQFKKRVGLIRSLDFIEPSAAAARALEESAEKLRRRGYEVVEFAEAQGLLQEAVFWSIVVFLKNAAMLNCISGQVSFGETLLPLYKFARRMHRAPRFVLRLLQWKEGPSRRGLFYRAFFRAKQTNQMTLGLKMGDLYSRLEQKMTDLGVSALLTVGLPVAPLRHFDSDVCQSIACYLFIFNGLNMPAGVCSVTRVREDEQVYESRHDDYISDKLRDVMRGSKGLPMGVQVAARAFQDEVVVKVLEDIQGDAPGGA